MPMKKPAGSLKAKPAASDHRSHVKSPSARASVRVLTSAAAQTHAMKLLMKTLGKQSSSVSVKSGKPSKKALELPEIVDQHGAEEDDEAEDDFEPDRAVEPGPPPVNGKPRFLMPWHEVRASSSTTCR